MATRPNHVLLPCQFDGCDQIAVHRSRFCTTHRMAHRKAVAAVRNKIKYAEAKANGMCGRCWIRQRIPGSSRCVACQADATAFQSRIRSMFVADGKCARCGTAAVFPRSAKTCVACREKDRLYRHERKESGRCSHCPGKIEPPNWTCDACRERTNERMRKKRERNRAKLSVA